MVITLEINTATILEKKLSLIDIIYSETLENIAIYLQKREVVYGNNLIEYLRKPEPYPGNPILIKTIVTHYLNQIISDHYKDLQKEGLFVNSTYNQIFSKIYPKPKPKPKINLKLKTNKGGKYSLQK